MHIPPASRCTGLPHSHLVRIRTLGDATPYRDFGVEIEEGEPVHYQALFRQGQKGLGVADSDRGHDFAHS